MFFLYNEASYHFVFLFTPFFEPFHVAAVNEDENPAKNQRQEDREWARDQWLNAWKHIVLRC